MTTHLLTHLTPAALCLCLAACAADEPAASVPDESGVTVAIHTRVTADSGSGAGSSARLVFWHDDPYHRMVAGQAATPRYSVVLDREINRYTWASQVYYTTPYSYPAGEVRLHATGYAPDYAFDHSADFTELTVRADCRDGSLDLLTCPGNLAHSGSSADPFHVTADHELQFRHLTARLVVYGSRNDEMLGLVGVRNIRIRLRNADQRLTVPATLRTYRHVATADEAPRTADASTYVVATEVPLPADHELVYDRIIDPNETPELGAFYLLTAGIPYGETEGTFNPLTGEWIGTLTGTPNLRLDVQAEFYDASTGLESEGGVTGEWNDVPVTWDKDTFLTGDKFLPGYEYKITLEFNRVGIAIKAEAVPWDSEEMHEYPVRPTPSRP